LEKVRGGADERKVIDDGTGVDGGESSGGSSEHGLEHMSIAQAGENVTLLHTIDGLVRVDHGAVVADEEGGWGAIRERKNAPEHGQPAVIVYRGEDPPPIDGVECVAAVDVEDGVRGVCFDGCLEGLDCPLAPTGGEGELRVVEDVRKAAALKVEAVAGS